MGAYLSIPVLAVAVILQATVMPELRIAGGAPDLVLLIVVAYSLLSGFERGAVWAVVGGLLYDLLSSVPLGTTALALVVATGVNGAVFGRVAPRSFFQPVLAAGLATVIVHAATLVVLAFSGRSLPLFQTLGYVTVPALLYNMAGMVVFYRLIGAFFTAGRPRRVESIQR
ncbi:MAG: hypothetical protein Kow0077_05750 [Anaerolineae bacterium]